MRFNFIRAGSARARSRLRGSETITRSEDDAKKGGEDAKKGEEEDEFRTIRAIFSNRIRFNALKFGLKALLNAVNAMGPLMVLVVGGYLVIQGQTTIGTVVAFVSGFDRSRTVARSPQLLSRIRTGQGAVSDDRAVGRGKAADGSAPSKPRKLAQSGRGNSLVRW